MKKILMILTSMTLVTTLFLNFSKITFANEGGPSKSHLTNYWRVTVVSNDYTTYSGWYFCTDGYGYTGNSLTCQKSVGWSDSWSGTLTVGISNLEASIGHSVSRDDSTTTSYTAVYTQNNQYVEIDYRHRYTSNDVKQEKFEYNSWDGTTRKTGDYAWVYPDHWDGFSYRALRSP